MRIHALRLLLLINVAGFALELGLSGLRGMAGVPVSILVALGANDPPSIWDGQVWRLLTSAFLHGNLPHLLLNMYGLYVLGDFVEATFGGWRTLVLYAGAAVLGSAASVALSGGVGVGASGAVFGFAGALLALSLLARDQEQARGLRNNLVFIVALNLGVAWLNNLGGSGIQIDNYAHVGGLVGGFALALGMLSSRKFGPLKPLTIAGWATYALLATLLLGMARKPPDTAPLRALAGEQALQAGKLEEAARQWEEARALSPMDPGVLALEASLARHRKDTEGVQRALRKLLTLDPLPTGKAPQAVEERQLLWALNTLRVRAEADGDWPFAVQVLERMAKLFPGEASFSNDYAWSLLCLPENSPEQRRQALEFADRARRLERGSKAAINHTYAEALNQNGRPAEAVELLEGLAADAAGSSLGKVMADAVDLGPGFFKAEMERVKAGKPVVCEPPKP